MTRQVVCFNVLCVFCSQDDLDVVHSLAADHAVQKDNDQAAKCRERGNCSFKSRDYTIAVLHYSQVKRIISKERSLPFQIILTDIPKTKDSAQLQLPFLFSLQGVCSAPPGSEQLSLCYANRSAALFYLQHYQVSSDHFQQIHEMLSHVFNELCNLQSLIIKLPSNSLRL